MILFRRFANDLTKQCKNPARESWVAPRGSRRGTRFTRHRHIQRPCRPDGAAPTRHRLDPADCRRSAKIRTNKRFARLVDIGGGQKIAEEPWAGRQIPSLEKSRQPVTTICRKREFADSR